MSAGHCEKAYLLNTDFQSSVNNIDVSGHGFDAHMSTVDSTQMFYVDNGLYLVDDTLNTKSDISSSLVMSSSAAGMEGFSIYN